MKITEALCAEHLVFHSMFDHIETMAPQLKTLAEVKALAALMEAMLKAHSNTEDDLFIGPLEHCFEQMGQREAFMEEHLEMDSSLRRVREAKRIKEALQRLLAAVSYSRDHFDKEERIIFPMTERILKSETLSTLGQTWIARRNRSPI